MLDINWISCVFFQRNNIVRIPFVFSAKTERTHRGLTADALNRHLAGTLKIREPFFTTTRIQHLYQLLVQNQLCRPLDATLSPSDGQAVQLSRIQKCSAWRHPTTVIDASAISFSQAIKDSTAQSARLTRLPTHQQVRDASPRVPGKQGDQFTPNKRQPRGSVKTQASTPS